MIVQQKMSVLWEVDCSYIDLKISAISLVLNRHGGDAGIPIDMNGKTSKVASRPHGHRPCACTKESQYSSNVAIMLWLGNLPTSWLCCIK